jgi:hypothetical protein
MQNAAAAGTFPLGNRHVNRLGYIAMHLWPERVIAKCAQDRSLAITHGLEEAFWHEYEDGKWQPIAKPEMIDRFVRDRANPSVKAALKNLIEAPETAAGPKNTRKRNAA